MKKVFASLSAVAVLAAASIGTAQTVTVLDDFATFTAENHPDPSGVAGTWYDAASNTFGTPSAASGAMQIDDGGFTNGVYAEMTTTVPATASNYFVEIDIVELNEDPANSNGIRDYGVGVWVNASHRTVGGNFVTENAAPDATGSTNLTLDTGDNSVTGTPADTIQTGLFSATAGDTIFIVLACNPTDLAADSGTWGTSYVQVDDLELIQPPTSVEDWSILE